MLRKTILSSLLAACLMLTPMMVRAGSPVSTPTITVNVTVDTFAEWASTTPVTINLGHVTSMSGATNSQNFTLYANVNCHVAGVKGDKDGVLTDASSNVLTTNYKISGDASGNVNLLPAADFFVGTNFYSVTHGAPGNGAYTVTLQVEALPSSAAAPTSGAYTCGLTLEASWS